MCIIYGKKKIIWKKFIDSVYTDEGNRAEQSRCEWRGRRELFVANLRRGSKRFMWGAHLGKLVFELESLLFMDFILSGTCHKCPSVLPMPVSSQLKDSTTFCLLFHSTKQNARDIFDVLKVTFQDQSFTFLLQNFISRIILQLK